MFILLHLLTGLLLGYLLADRLGTRAVVLPCMLGALLPDLVDKPLGILLLRRLIGSGRIYLHTLLFSSVLLLAGVVTFHRYRQPALLAVGIGVASHQILDLMWTNPRNWFYPFLGPFRHSNVKGWFRRELRADLINPMEWLSGALLLVLLLPVFWPARTYEVIVRYRHGLRLTVSGAAVVLAVPGLYLLSSGALRHRNRLLGWRSPGYTLMAGAVFVFAAYTAYRLRIRLGSDATSIGPD